MRLLTRSGRIAWLLAPAFALALAGCSMFGRGEPETTAATASANASAAPEEGELDVRRYLGPDYCPELRIPEGAQLLRRYEPGHEEDAAYVIWQASIGNTARECLYDLAGNVTLKIGVSGRVIAGPKGGPGAVSVPIKIAVVKYRESILASEPLALAITIPAQGSAVFTEVREITLPSPGSQRDYIIYVGLDVGDWDPLSPSPTVAAPEPVLAAEEPVFEPEPEPEPQPAAAPPPPPQPTGPRTLPVPSGGFVLPGG
jgi:hypothetical protein